MKGKAASSPAAPASEMVVVLVVVMVQEAERLRGKGLPEMPTGMSMSPH